MGGNAMYKLMILAICVAVFAAAPRSALAQSSAAAKSTISAPPAPDTAATANGTASADAAQRLTIPAKPAPPGDGWRYVWENGRWWYWKPNNSWVYWEGGRWVDFAPQSLTGDYATSGGYTTNYAPAADPYYARRGYDYVGPRATYYSPYTYWGYPTWGSYYYAPYSYGGYYASPSYSYWW